MDLVSLLLVAAAALLAALLVQPLRHAGRPWAMALLLLLALAAVPLQSFTLIVLPPAPGMLALYAVLALPQAALAAMLLARPAPANLRPALAALGRGPGWLALRLGLPALLPGLALGWLAGAGVALATAALRSEWYSPAAGLSAAQSLGAVALRL